MSTSLTGKFAALTTDKAYQAVLLLKFIIQPDTPEGHLWFEVLARAVMDIGRKDIYNSDWVFTNGETLEAICGALNISHSVVHRILKKCLIWPPPASRIRKISHISNLKTKPNFNQEYETHENNPKIYQTINLDKDFSYNPDHRYSCASGL